MSMGARVVSRWFTWLIGVSLCLAGCGPSPASRQQADLNAESLSLRGADKMLGAPVEELPQDIEPSALSAEETDEAGIQDAADGPAVNKDLPDVKTVQRALKALGFYDGKIDGKIGPKTKTAIRDFQKSRGLKVDGKVGPATWALLKGK